MKTLVISAYLPGESAPQAGQRTAFRNIQWLAERGEVTLMSFVNEADEHGGDSGLDRVCKKVYKYRVSRLSRLVGLVKRPLYPLLVSARWRSGFARMLDGLIERERFDRIHFEWAQMLIYLEVVSRRARTTVYVHDVITQWAERRAHQRRGGWAFEAWRCRRWERLAYAGVDHIFVPSKKDLFLIRSLRAGVDLETTVLPLYYRGYRSQASASHRGTGLNLIFWGALGRSENAQAARWIVRELSPRLVERGLSFKVILAGSNPPPDIKAMESEVISVPGFVADPSKFFCEADIAVLPIFDGAGVKVKVLECLASGLPVLTTDIGAEGIEASGRDGLVVLAGNADAFAEMICRLAHSGGMRGELAEAAVVWAKRQATDFRRQFLLL